MIPQVLFPATYVRGGTSRAILFRDSDLPADRRAWPSIFAAALGSPDETGRQLDGLGGGITSLSKVAVVSRSTRPDCDVDYHFFQIDPRSGAVQTLATCGNIISSIGPFAVANHWAAVAETGPTCVRIYDVNSKKRVDASFVARNARELASIDGVPGEAPPVWLTFRKPGGSMTSALFPTAAKLESLSVSGLGELRVTLIDAGLPTVIVAAASLGLRGDESPSELSGSGLLRRMEALRIAAGLRMKVPATQAALESEITNVPDIAVVSTTSAGSIQARFFSGGAAHRAAPITSSIALASACSIEGTVAAELVKRNPGKEQICEIANPAGLLPVTVSTSPDLTDIESVTVMRTTRVIMRGEVLVPLARIAGGVPSEQELA